MRPDTESDPGSAPEAFSGQQDDRPDLVEPEGVNAGPEVSSGRPVRAVDSAAPSAAGGPGPEGPSHTNGGFLSEHPPSRPPEPGQQLAAGEG